MQERKEGLPQLLCSCVKVHALFACRSSDWATTTCRLLGHAICLSHKDGGKPLSVLPKDRAGEIAGFSSTLSLGAERQAGKLWIPFLKVCWYDSTWEMNHRSTNSEADAPTTTPSHRYTSNMIWHECLLISKTVELIGKLIYIFTNQLCQRYPSGLSVSYIGVRYNGSAGLTKLTITKGAAKSWFK